MSEQPSIALSETAKEFVLHWGEMGTHWGINRTVAQIHALLYLSPEPLTAEVIAATLEVARSNVSTSLRELQGWGIIRPVHILGDRREHYEALKDVWELFRIIVDQRKRREIDPTVALLHRSVATLEKNGKAEAYTLERLRAMTEFFDNCTLLYEQLRCIPVPALKAVARSRGKLKRLLTRKEVHV